MKSLIARITVLILVISITACAQGSGTPQYLTKWGQQVVFHSFEFDAQRDSKDIEVLDYMYKTANENIVGNPWTDLRDGTTRQSRGDTGVMPVGETLYVKWKIKSTGEVIEKSIDLKPILPASMKDKKLFFILEKQNIFIYTSSHQPVRENFTPQEWQEIDKSLYGTRLSRRELNATRSMIQIYPSQQVIFPYVPKK
ncbi:MAG: hypothetical protein QE279_08430 [Rhodoferax sp.]|nr:hypothetical protein [Rhodoferax sp.]